jgi:16S rRNA (cytidine1402-2'-O)-methyltransferase
MSIIYLVPTLLHESALETIPAYVIKAIRDCTVVFAENERSARRFFKTIDKTIVIDEFEWFAIHKAEKEEIINFRQKISENKNIIIISEAGCPGIADPGQILVAVAQELNCVIKPLTGPSSVLLALMASGMNGQHFEFTGYLPIENSAKENMIKELEQGSAKNNSTKIFIETPYRNNQLIDSLLKICNNTTKLCIAVNLTSPQELVKTLTIQQWKNMKPDIHKQPAIFLLYSGT